jgi:hypothetical protein
MSEVEVTFTGKACEYDGCDKPATTTAKGRNEDRRRVAAYCETNAEMVADENFPEYVESCPNCGCRFGVN